MRDDLYDGESWRTFVRFHYDTTFQLQPDGRIYLVAVQTADIDRPAVVSMEPFVGIQPVDFPVSPVSRECD